MIPETQHEPELITALRDAAILLYDLSCTGHDLDEGTAHALLSHRLTDGMSHLMDLDKAVNAQAEDEGLWFIAQYASEAYLQQELRKVHQLVEALLGRAT